MEVAKQVVEALYGGSLEALRSEGELGPSFNQLARDLSSTIRKTTLHRALWAYEVCQTTHLEGVPPVERVNLTVAHYYAVRTLSAELRSQLLSEAICSRWSARRLREEVAARAGASPRQPSTGQIFELLQRVKELRPAQIDVTPLTGLSDAEARRYRAIAADLQGLMLRAETAFAERHTATGAE
jgi:hypothetical protein